MSFRVVIQIGKEIEDWVNLVIKLVVVLISLLNIENQEKPRKRSRNTANN
jgi:hypothetical protein